MSFRETPQLRTLAPGAWRRHLRERYADRPLAEQREAKLRADQVRLHDLAPRPGVAWFPLVGPEDRVDHDQVAGVLARVCAGGTGPAVPEEGQRHVRAWVAQLVGVGPHALDEAPPLTFQGVPPGWTVTGRSWELAAALALVTHLAALPTRVPLVASGRLASGTEAGQVESVDARDAKARILANEAPEATHFLARQAGTAPLDDWLPGGWYGPLAMALEVTPELGASEMWSAWRQGNRAGAERLVPVALASKKAPVRAVALWVRGSAALHRGAVDEGMPDLLAAREVLQATQVRRFQVEELEASLGIALLDTLAPKSAVALLEGTLARLDAVPTGDRFERWREVTLQVAGSLRRALVGTGDLPQALAVHQTWSLGAAAVDTERARCLLDLADVQLRLGQTDDARYSLDQAQRALAHAPVAARRLTDRFLRVQRVRAGLQPVPAGWRVEAPDWHDFPQPLELAEAILALDKAGRASALAGWPTGGSPIVLWVSSRLAALLLLEDPTLAWGQEVLAALALHVDDARMGTGAEAALATAQQGDGAAWAARVPY